MTLIYDAGVLVAAYRNDRRVWADHRVRLELGLAPATTAPVIAEGSRSPRQAQLRRLLRGCDVIPFSQEHAHKVGALLAKARTSDVVDAHIAVVASELDGRILTSDPDDLQHLVNQLQRRVAVKTLND